MTSIPYFRCPTCDAELEYHVTIELLDPPVGKIDTGYCPRCAVLYERVQETGTFYDSTGWPPVCRTCRQPVTAIASSVAQSDPEIVIYQCARHPEEKWICRGERWTRTP